MNLTRRSYLQATLATVAGACAKTALPAFSSARGTNRDGFQFEGPIRPDHAPTIELDRDDKRSGYTMGGKVFAFGFMKGIMEALNLPNS